MKWFAIEDRHTGKPMGLVNDQTLIWNHVAKAWTKSPDTWVDRVSGGSDSNYREISEAEMLAIAKTLGIPAPPV